jgi:excisionase family DNA binding protein
MSNLNFNIPALDEIELRLEGIESMLKQIHKEKAQHAFGLLTTQEAAKALQITTRHLQNLRDRGDIGFIQYGRVVRYKTQDIQAYIDEYYINPGKRKGGES